MKCVIVDDELLAREILSHLVLKTPDLITVAAFSNAIDLIKFINTKPELDLIFLDIHLPNFSGFDFLQTMNDLPQVVIVSNDENLALEAFNYDCIVDYLVKPVTPKRFERAMERVRMKMHVGYIQPVNSNELQEIFVNIDKRIIKIGLNTINYLKANGDYVQIITEQQSYRVHSTLTQLQVKLPKSQFVKTHRSYIVNIAKVNAVKDTTVVIGKDAIPVSKNNREELIERLNRV
jgi:DNA-binding LytR/AlgR family response regulator